MDPNETLRRIRELVGAEDDGAVDSTLDRLDRVADLFVGLDAWLTQGGFLPEAWTGAIDAHAETMNYCPVCGAYCKEAHRPDCAYVTDGRIDADGRDTRTGKRLHKWAPTVEDTDNGRLPGEDS